MDLPDITELEDFETPIVVERIKPLVWSAEKYEVAQLLATKGMNDERVSEITKVPVTSIKRWKRHPDFRAYINKYILDIAENCKAYRISLYLKTIDARVEKIESIGDYSLLSTKDTADLLESLRKETEKNEDKEQSQYLKTIQALIEKSPSTIEITHRSDKSDQSS